ncbi:MAG: hypothetical protein OXI63_01615 [Candidatus Poribacteria bacterium]|nr:hypothetical protein [Candidatus Poribacteria bacterium]
MSNRNKPVITPIDRQTWTVGEDFIVEVPISNADTAWAEGPLYGHGAHSWNQDEGILTITGHADKENSSYVDVIGKKGDNQVRYTIYYDAVKSHH